ncbi:dTMP kinase [Bartonella sp. LJL80]
MKGCFITFEGGEGAGKSTQIKALQNHLKGEGFDVLVTREPGGTSGAEAVRHVLLSGIAEKYGPAVEAILFAAARADHVDGLIAPALEAGKIVLCDRFIDSTRVYQGLQSSGEDSYLTILERVAIDGCFPDLTFILDIPAKQGMMRAMERRAVGTDIDRFEKDTLEIQELRRQAFLKIAHDDPKRCNVIDATQTIEQIATQIANICDEYLKSNSSHD